jgi:hypothetical protein
MNLVPTLATLAVSCLIWAIITANLSLEEYNGIKFDRALSPIVPAVLLILAMLFTTAAIFIYTNPHILQ